jgi:D-lactate dehydrogenase
MFTSSQGIIVEAGSIEATPAEDQSDKIIDDDVLARLLSFNNVIVTSHQGFFTREAMHNIAETTLQNIQDFIDGKTLVNEVS